MVNGSHYIALCSILHARALRYRCNFNICLNGLTSCILIIAFFSALQPTKDRAKKPRKDFRFEDTSGPKGAVVSEGSSMSNPQSAKSDAVTGTPRTSTFLPPDTRYPHSPMLPDGVGSRSPVRSTVFISGTRCATDRRAESALSSSSLTRPPPNPRAHGMTDAANRHALPGLTTSSTAVTSQNTQADVPKERDERTAPAKSARIPSTGNRALVMDVAQALSEVPRGDSPSTVDSSLGLASSIEKRKLNYERHTPMTLPTLKEEQTPLSTPMHTLSKSVDNVAKGSLKMEATPTDSSDACSEKRDIVHVGRFTNLFQEAKR